MLINILAEESTLLSPNGTNQVQTTTKGIAMVSPNQVVANSSHQQQQSPSTDDSKDIATSGPKRGLMRRRNSTTISMVRALPTEDTEDEDEPILPNFDDDSFDGNCGIFATSTPQGHDNIAQGNSSQQNQSMDEYGLEMHDDVALDDQSPALTHIGMTSSVKIR